MIKNWRLDVKTHLEMDVFYFECNSWGDGGAPLKNKGTKFLLL